MTRSSSTPRTTRPRSATCARTESKVAQIVSRDLVTVRRPEKGTRPGLFYKGAHQATLDPLAARRPDGGLYSWATQGGEHDPGHVPGGHPGRPSSSAEALLSYDIPHRQKLARP